jgi:hypothetical protein
MVWNKVTRFGEWPLESQETYQACASVAGEVRCYGFVFSFVAYFNLWIQGFNFFVELMSIFNHSANSLQFLKRKTGEQNDEVGMTTFCILSHFKSTIFALAPAYNILDLLSLGRGSLGGF